MVKLNETKVTHIPYQLVSFFLVSNDKKNFHFRDKKNPKTKYLSIASTVHTTTTATVINNQLERC